MTDRVEVRKHFDFFFEVLVRIEDGYIVEAWLRMSELAPPVRHWLAGEGDIRR